MFILEITNGVNQGQCLRLQHGQSVVIGRSANADLTLNDTQASGKHAQFDWDETGFSVRDLESLNGCYVNGAPVTGRAYVSVGDFFQVGRTILQLKQAPPGAALQDIGVADQASPKSSPKIFSAKTMMAPSYEELIEKAKAQSALVKVSSPPSWDSPNKSLPRDETASKPPPQTLGGQSTMLFDSTARHQVNEQDFDSAAQLLARLEADRDPNPKLTLSFCASQIELGGRFEDFVSDKIRFGRETENEVFLDDDSVSLNHMTIERRDGRYFVCDSQSSNGTYVNGHRVVERRIKDGDLIGVGAYLLVSVMFGNKLGLMVNTTTTIEPETGRPKTMVADDPAFAASIGVILKPSTEKKKKKKKKATDLIWFATSDLDRGVFRARSALLAMLIALLGTGYLLATGNSTELASGELISAHESTQFMEEAEALGHGGCTSCHIGVGQVSTLKCVSCHAESRPRMAHAVINIQCAGCHQDHQGKSFLSAANATIVCVECHAEPHANLLKINPQLVEGFRINAPADTPFHMMHHISETISCVDCHGDLIASGPRGARAACGQCHAPETVSANQCQDCHPEHPDQEVSKVYAAVPASPVPKFRYSALLWLLGLIGLPLALAGLMPRQRKVEINDQKTSESESSEKKPA